MSSIEPIIMRALRSVSHKSYFLHWLRIPGIALPKFLVKVMFDVELSVIRTFGSEAEQ
jgi:hypothetical protein